MTTTRPADAADPKTTTTATVTNRDFRSTEMHLMNEALARAHCMEQREQAMKEQRVRRVLAARRLDRRAARAAQRARNLAAAAVSLRSRTY
ncbi:hypothetical protein [Jiangella anatolica]|uniref:Uncharacterized protein n=1 Tax=Jiangella anatolica TaxID=2670374 RepID=A0A2W2B6W8_9ACTN|nr:hypothetical protein [Jiangella anatolica]PZF80790.1 hypothetical protein C1I92_24150 [Jiangella anatolica]